MDDIESISSSSTILSVAMRNILEKLKFERHRSSTRSQYYCVWKLFNDFFLKLDEKPSSWTDRLNLFVAYLALCKKKSTTIKSYASAIKAILFQSGVRINGDREKINSIAQACKLNTDVCRVRLPIRKGLLTLILDETDKIYANNHYNSVLYRTLFITAYFGLFRIGELTKSRHVVKAADVQVGLNKNKLSFTLRSSKKHCKGNKPQIDKIAADAVKPKQHTDNKQNWNYCPFHLIKNYLLIKKNQISFFKTEHLSCLRNSDKF